VKVKEKEKVKVKTPHSNSLPLWGERTEVRVKSPPHSNSLPLWGERTSSLTGEFLLCLLSLDGRGLR
jgi:hypothetical protein